MMLFEKNCMKDILELWLFLPYFWSLKNEKLKKKDIRDFPGGTVVKNPPANAGDMGLIPGLGRSHMPQSN